MTRQAALLLVSIATAWAQNKPFELRGTCSAESVQNLSLPCSFDEPCPLFLELAAAEQVGPRLLVTGNIHTGSATLESVLLLSDDEGLTWTEGHARLPAAVLDQIQFVDVEAGWINGHSLTGVPRDAFFLLTTDGGKTWRRRPITSDARTGAVEQFWFESRTRGKLALDRIRAAEDGLRYELWESMTGGESWSILQVDSKPVAFTRPNRAAGLRLRTDAASKTYLLERPDGAKWAPVASIAVSAGECKPPEPASVEAEPPPEPVEVTEPAVQSPAPPRKRPSLRKPQD